MVCSRDQDDGEEEGQRAFAPAAGLARAVCERLARLLLYPQNEHLISLQSARAASRQLNSTSQAPLQQRRTIYRHRDLMAIIDRTLSHCAIHTNLLTLLILSDNNNDASSTHPELQLQACDVISASTDFVYITHQSHLPHTISYGRCR